MDMQTVVLALMGVILVLALVIVVLLSRRGEQNRALAEKLNTLENGLIALQAHASARQSDTQALVEKIAGVQIGLTELRSYVQARQDMERRTMESIRRLETVIAGTQSKGAAGENILEAVFARLPPEWQLRNFRVGNKTVEFGLRLPNGLVLPIDSKWTATALLERFAAARDVAEQQRLKRRIEREVLHKAQEVQKYLDPRLTTTFGVAVVPDAIYDLCTGIQAEAFRLNVVLISYSLFVPYLLMVFQTTLKSAHSIDMQKLEAYLADVQEHLDRLQGELEGRFSRAIRMLTNSRNEMSTHLSQIRGGLTGLQVSAPAAAPDDGSSRHPAEIPGK